MDGYDSDDFDITVDVERNEVPSNYDDDEEIANISSSDSVTPGEGDGDPADANDEEEDDVLQMPLRKLKAPAPVICRDYWMSRTEAESFKLCQMCPQPPSSAACYKISCAKHQKK